MATAPRDTVELDTAAARDFRGLPRPVQERLAEVLRALAVDPRPRRAEKLSGTRDQYRIRRGDYRIVYAISDERLLVLVLTVGGRGDVSKKNRRRK